MVHLMKHNDNDKDKTDDEDKYETIQKTAKAPVGLNDPAFSDEEICDSVRPLPLLLKGPFRQKC